MNSYRCDDWGRFVGAEVEIRRRGRLVRAGVVDAVAADVAMLWLAADLRLKHQSFGTTGQEGESRRGPPLTPLEGNEGDTQRR